MCEKTWADLHILTDSLQAFFVLAVFLNIEGREISYLLCIGLSAGVQNIENFQIIIEEKEMLYLLCIEVSSGIQNIENIQNIIVEKEMFFSCHLTAQ